MSERILYLVLVIIGALSYTISVFSPLFSVSEFYIFSDTLTIYSIVNTLYVSQEWLLFLVIFIFGVVFPLAKYMLLLLYGLCIDSRKLSSNIIQILEIMSKWAMLDVFVIAILIASIKLKSLASAETHYGLYLFISSIVIAIICTYIYKRLLVQKQKSL